MARSLALFLAASLVAASPAERAPKTLSAQGAVPEGGKCKNEIVDDKVTGNHCVLLKGGALTKFQDDTKQDFGSPTEWCICLHLAMETNPQDADYSQCSNDACCASKMCSCSS